MKRILCAAAFVCLPAFAQTDIFNAKLETTLAAAGTALSVQLPTTGNHVTEITEATVSSSEACSLRIETNGAEATALNATAVTLIALNPETTPPALAATPNIT